MGECLAGMGSPQTQEPRLFGLLTWADRTSAGVGGVGRHPSQEPPPQSCLPHLTRPIPVGAGGRMAHNFSCLSSLKLFLIWKWFPDPSQERVSGTGNIFLLKTKNSLTTEC